MKKLYYCRWNYLIISYCLLACGEAETVENLDDIGNELSKKLADDQM